MVKESLDVYDYFPEDMIVYLRHNGHHFNHKLCDYAVSKMKGKDGNSITPITKDSLDRKLEIHNITIENNTLYDYVYVANMCKADFLGSSITDDTHMCQYVKDVIDDVDGYDGIVFNRWYADMCHKGEPIDWYNVL